MRVLTLLGKVSEKTRGCSECLVQPSLGSLGTQKTLDLLGPTTPTVELMHQAGEGSAGQTLPRTRCLGVGELWKRMAGLPTYHGVFVKRKRGLGLCPENMMHPSGFTPTA